MIRIGASAIIGFLLLILQAMIVMRLNGYESIMFTSPVGILSVWLLNAVLSFSILTQFKPWFDKQFNHEANAEAE